MTAHLKYDALEPLKVPRPVERLAWIREAVRGRRVVDLGAFDETAIETKQKAGEWLHLVMASTAEFVAGIDASPKLPSDRFATSPNSVILRGDVMRAGEVAEEFRADTIVGGEVIEHLPNTLSFLEALRSDARTAGKQLILTTPNASSFHNLALGMAGRESQHPDHLHIYSYKTLITLLGRAGITDIELVPYHVGVPEMKDKSSGVKLLAATVFEKFARASETLFPMLSAGWIVRGKL